MRKRSIKLLNESIMWDWIIYLLPLLLLLILTIRDPSNTSAFQLFNDTMNEFNQTDIYLGLDAIFGENGYLPCIGSNTSFILLYFAYFIYMNLIHIAVDVLVFLPRLFHQWIDSFCRGD